MRKRGLQLADNMFGIRGRYEDFEAAERELGPIPRGRTVKTLTEEIRFFRIPTEDNCLWPTTGELIKFNLRLIPSGSMCALEETDVRRND